MDNYSGRIIRHVWKSDTNDFAISLFRTNSIDQRPEEDLKIKGPLRRYKPGLNITVSGNWENHPKFGPTFMVGTACIQVPKDKTAINAYLKTYVHGVGEKTLKKIVDFFGESALDVIRQTPDRLNELSGISQAVQKKIVTGCKREKALRTVALTLDGYNMPVGTNEKLVDKWGADDAQAILDSNPYAALIGLNRVGFKTADAIAKKGENFNADSLSRAENAVLAFVDSETKNGHSCVPMDSIFQYTVQEEQISRERTQQAIANHFNSRELVQTKVDTSSGPIEVAYTPAQYYSETKVTEHINRIIYAPFEKASPREAVLYILAELEQLAQKQLTDEQKMAVERAFAYKVSVLTGKPGTGKTLTTKAIVAVAERLGLKYGLCAPTGRAAKNMTNACGKKAVTIHRLLEHKGAEKLTPGDSPFAKHEDNQLGMDILLVDEASMMDVQLLRHLIEAVPNGCRVVFIGDDNQLPSVGAGRCLNDMIRSGIFPLTELHIIHRQAQESHIILNAHRILDGQNMQFPCRDEKHLAYSDCAFFEAPMVPNENTGKDIEDQHWVQDKVRHLCQNVLPAMGLDPIRDVQVLSPRKDGTCGVKELNRVLQVAVNPGGRVLMTDQMGRDFRQNDRVMVIKNNYDLNVFNGDIGTLVGYDLQSEHLLFDFYGEEVKIPKSKMEIVTLAYAATVHKSQGSEYKVVILLVLKQHGIMLQRNLLYTGVTRAKQRLIVIGSKIALGIATRNVKPVQRNTLLWHRLSRLRVHAQSLQ